MTERERGAWGIENGIGTITEVVDDKPWFSIEVPQDNPQYSNHYLCKLVGKAVDTPLSVGKVVRVSGAVNGYKNKPKPPSNKEYVNMYIAVWWVDVLTPEPPAPSNDDF